MSLKANPEQNQPANHKEKQVFRNKVLDYAQIRNLNNPHKQPMLLPGLGLNSRKISKAQKVVELQIIQQPRLLTTAKKHMKQVHQQTAKSETQRSNNLGLSSFLNSREVTPNNPLGTSFQRKKNTQNYKNKLNSNNTQLFDIASDPEYPMDKHSKIKSPEFRLFDYVLGQSQIVYQHVFGKERVVNPKLIKLWKDCLSHQDKTQIYLPVANEEVQIPYSHARIYPLNEIEQGFKGIFGTGKSRALTYGEQAVIIQSIQKYLQLSFRQPLKIGRKDFDIIQTVLTDCKMYQLQNFPVCMKQVQTHFKLMATKWKYSGKLDTKDKIVQSALIMGKNNFLDLTKSNILTDYLLQHSNLNEL